MATFFLGMIYAAFISLGLPDSAMGAVWPVMRQDLNANIDWIGLVTVVTACGTVVSSLSAERLLHRFGTGRVTLVSVFMTAVALAGVALVPSFWWLLLLAVPLGLGAGAVDSGLNNFVALHYAARHMSWLHGFWGLGATLGPMLLSLFLSRGNNWRGGFGAIAALQGVLVIILAVTLPMWDTYEDRAALRAESVSGSAHGFGAMKIKGVPFALITFFCYCAMESSIGLWSASYLVDKGVSAVSAAQIAGCYFIGITVGRMGTGLLTSRFSCEALIRAGQILCVGAIVLFLLPVLAWVQALALILLGVGSGPVYPCMIHETPRRFGAQNSPAVIGLQMASAYVGIVLMPPLLGAVAGVVGTGIVPLVWLVEAAAMLLCAELLRRCTVSRELRP